MGRFGSREGCGVQAHAGYAEDALRLQANRKREKERNEHEIFISGRIEEGVDFQL